jgi:hypothetical protein
MPARKAVSKQKKRSTARKSVPIATLASPAVAPASTSPLPASSSPLLSLPQWLSLVVVALVLISAGIWFWKASLPAETFSELIFSESPSLHNQSIQFAVVLRSHESQSLQWDINAYFADQLISRKHISVPAGSTQRVGYEIPIEGDVPHQLLIHVRAQRSIVEGIPFKQPLEVKDWLVQP